MKFTSVPPTPSLPTYVLELSHQEAFLVKVAIGSRTSAEDKQMIAESGDLEGVDPIEGAKSLNAIWNLMDQVINR